MGVGTADRPVGCSFAETELSGQPLKVARGILWGQATADPPEAMMHGALALWHLRPSGETGFAASPAARLILQLEAHLHLPHLSEALAQAACCCDRVAMENLYPLGFLAAFTGSIIEENVFAARKYKYYPEVLIFSLYDDYYQRYARRLHYRALSFVMSPP